MGPLGLAATAALTLVAVGDIRLDGPVGQVASQMGHGAPTAAVRQWLKGDIVFGNLECALTSKGKPANKKFTFRAPPRNAAILTAAGFTLVSLANNHTMDYGPEGLLDTIAVLDREGILHVGAGRNTQEARAPVFIERGGIRTGFIGLTSTLPEENWAGPNRPGVAYTDVRRLSDWIRDAKARCDVLVVSYHGGTELDHTPNAIQKELIDLFLQAGADIVLGHHPHVLQPVLSAPGKLTLHSLGNFLFVSPTPGTEWTVIARLRLDAEGIHPEFIPLEIQAGTLWPAGPYGRDLIRTALGIPASGLTSITAK